MSPRASLVIPFFNEEQRFDPAKILALTHNDLLTVLLVDDGSTDETPRLLEKVADGERIRLLPLDQNRGKSEAVRRGMLEEIGRGASVVGYADGDFATPVDELLRLAQLAITAEHRDALLGARVRLAGREIIRRNLRHYLGRAVATFIDLRTGLPVYDTQCGAKFFRVTPALSEALRAPFRTRWLFDVELLSNLRDAIVATGRDADFREEPLERWRDVPGSRIRGREVARVARDFGRLERALRANRREHPRR